MSDTNENDATVIKLAVDAKYSQEASRPSASCCSRNDEPEVPFDARSVSLGCGSPINYVKFHDGITFVDLGCGGGIDVFAAANKLAPLRGRIIGIDATMKMIARARRTALQNNYTNVEFRLGEIENLPLESESVDVVTSNCVINLVPDKMRAFKEIYRVLKRGGTITISDIVSKKQLPERIRNDPRKWSECISGALSIHELEKDLMGAGFADFRLLEEAKWDKTEDEELELATITFYAKKPNATVE
jgi:SAM-dependent methyltransferase